MCRLMDIGVTPPLDAWRDPVIVNDQGMAALPHPFDSGAVAKFAVGTGLTVEWAPVTAAQIMLALWAGTEDAQSDEAVATVITRDELQRLILALMSIDQQLGPRG